MFFFGSVPKSPTQMGSRSAKNASEKFSCLGTFNEIGRQEDPNLIYPITFIRIDNGKIALLNSRAL